MLCDKFFIDCCVVGVSVVLCVGGIVVDVFLNG